MSIHLSSFVIRPFISMHPQLQSIHPSVFLPINPWYPFIHIYPSVPFHLNTPI
ncbi:hypothetical protein BC941DRAFT_410484, partial [Chlamydoabsidia padenii]